MRVLERVWRPARPVDVTATLGVHRRGARDPAYRIMPDGAAWRTCRTADGPATVRVTRRDEDVCATAWGGGAAAALEAVPGWLGADDDPDAFSPTHPVLAQAHRRHRGLLVGRTGLVLEALVPAVLEQKVTGQEATRGWRALLLRFGEPAPGPAPDGMRVVPTPRDWARIPSWEWHRAGVGPDRSRTVVQAARLASRLEEVVGLPAAEADRRLRAVPGVGPWTAAEVRQRALGDPDAVSVGDYNLPRLVAFSMAGEERADDARMLELLQPYAGHRHRACLLLAHAGRMPPRRAPRAPIRDYRAI
ncbi:MAG: DNA-3-methyladenine glycosylase family protein [Jiangellaceae bacterium]